MLPKLWLHLWFKATAVLPVCSCKGAKFGRERWKHNHRFKTSSKMWFLDALSTQKCTLCRGAHLETRWKLKGKWLWCVMVTDLMQSCKTRGLKRFTVSLSQPRAVPFQGYSPSASVEIYIMEVAGLSCSCAAVSWVRHSAVSWADDLLLTLQQGDLGLSPQLISPIFSSQIIIVYFGGDVSALC